MKIVALVLSAFSGGSEAGEAVIARFSEPVPLEFVALIVALVVPATAGTPVMEPFAVLSVRPEGSPLAPKLVGLFVAAIW
jgi:hypothetical protein